MNFNKFNTVKTIYWELDTMVKCPRCGYENNDISVYIVKIVHIRLKIHKLLIQIIKKTTDGILAQVKK